MPSNDGPSAARLDIESSAAEPGVRSFVLEAHTEFLRLLRAPSFSVPTIALPLMFYMMFGALLAPAHSRPELARHALASFMVLGTMAPGLFALGVTLATDREHGLLELKRALPIPRGRYLAAKTAMAMVFAAVVSLLLMAFAAVGAGVVLILMRWSLLLVLAVLDVIPFCAMGFLVGSVCKATAAPAVLNLWHLAQIAQVVAGSGAGSGTAVHVLVLSGMAAACFTAAQRALARPR
jgi:ABC-2 type transport system permease protein